MSAVIYAALASVSMQPTRNSTSTSASTDQTTSTTTQSQFSTGSNTYPSTDYNFFIAPNLARIEAVRQWFMEPEDVANSKAGYDPTYGMIRGGYWAGGFHDGFVLIDTQLILASSLDYFNSVNGIHTDIQANLRQWLGNTTFTDPSNGAVGTYNGTDRREVLFGTAIICIRGDTGQVYYVNGHTLSDPIPMTTALPTSCTSDAPGGMNTYAPWIELHYLQGNVQDAQQMFMTTINAWTSTPGTGIGHTTGGYFSDTFDSGPDQGKCKSSRTLGYWIEMARATGFWDLNNQTRTIAAQVVDELWAHQEPDGSISVNYPGCKNDIKATGESSGLALVAFDPRVPSWFNTSGGNGFQTTASRFSAQVGAASVVTDAASDSPALSFGKWWTSECGVRLFVCPTTASSKIFTPASTSTVLQVPSRGSIAFDDTVTNAVMTESATSASE